MIAARALVGALLAGGVIASSVTATVIQTQSAAAGARETITVGLGDTITPKFSILTDTTLGVVGTRIVAKRCGVGMVFLRNWKGGTQLSADTVTVNVLCINNSTGQHVDTIRLKVGDTMQLKTTP